MSVASFPLTSLQAMLPSQEGVSLSTGPGERLSVAVATLFGLKSPHGVAVLGSLLGDHWEFPQTWQQEWFCENAYLLPLLEEMHTDVLFTLKY